MSRDSLGNAAQHLLDTGVFADASIELTGSGMARTVVIHLKPLPPGSFAAATFANLVWWTPAELDAALRKTVPFYRGGIPPAGNLPDSVAAALTATLSGKGIQGTVSNTPVQPTNAHPQLTWEFRLDNPTVTLTSVAVTGEPATLGPSLDHVIAHATGAPYNEGLSGKTIDDLLLAPLRDAGYLNAKLTDISRVVAPAANGYGVRYSATIIPGDLFHVADITWQPTDIYSQQAFASDVKLHPGDIASQQALLTTERYIVFTYLRLGYLDAYVDPHPQEGTVVAAVTYALQVVPGDVYRIKSVTPLNLSPAAQQTFDAAWQLKPGAVYDPIYTANFLLNMNQHKLAGYTGDFQAVADPQTHLVDLTLKFSQTSSGQ